MKHLFTALIFVGCSYMAATAQVITISSACVSTSASLPSSSAPVETYVSASGLTPAAGVITIPNPLGKYAISFDGSTGWSTSPVTIPYTGGALPPTPIYIEMCCTGLSFSISVSGGGAEANMVACYDVSSCPCASLSISNIAGKPSVNVSPNPAHNALTISSPENIRTVTITDLMGQTVYEAPESTSGNPEATMHIDISGLPAGIYFAHINSAEVQKFVKE